MGVFLAHPGCGHDPKTDSSLAVTKETESSPVNVRCLILKIFFKPHAPRSERERLIWVMVPSSPLPLSSSSGVVVLDAVEGEHALVKVWTFANPFAKKSTQGCLSLARSHRSALHCSLRRVSKMISKDWPGFYPLSSLDQTQDPHRLIHPISSWSQHCHFGVVWLASWFLFLTHFPSQELGLECPSYLFTSHWRWRGKPDADPGFW